MSTPPRHVSANLPRVIVSPVEQRAPNDLPGVAAQPPVPHFVRVSVNTLHGTLLGAAERPRLQRRPELQRAPDPPPIFQDREREQERLRSELVPRRSAWLRAPAGCGSSTLLAWASSTDTTSLLPDGVLYIAGENAPPLLPDLLQRLFERFYTADVPVKVTPTAARAYLGRLHALCVFDRLRLSRDEQTNLARMLPNSAVLVASYVPGPENMRELRMAGLPPPDALALSAAAAGVATPDEQTSALLERLGAALGHLPLPLALVARQTGTDHERLSQAVAQLERTDDTRDPLLRALGLILGHLSNDERAVLAAVVGAGGSSASPEVLADLMQRDIAALEPLLHRLATQGLLRQRDRRWAIATPSLRLALDQTLQPAAERQRAAAWYAMAIQSHTDDLEWIGTELNNLLAATQTALTQGEMTQVAALTQGLQPYLVLYGLWSTWEQVIAWAEQAARTAADHALYAWVLHERGTHAALHGHPRAAAEALHEARRLRRRLGNLVGAAFSQHNLAYLNQLTHTRPAPPPADSPPQSTGRLPALTPWQWAVGALPLVALLISIIIGALFPSLFTPPPVVTQALTPTPTLDTTSIGEPYPAPPLEQTGAAIPTSPLVPTVPAQSPTSTAALPSPSPSATATAATPSPTQTETPSATATEATPSATPEGAYPGPAPQATPTSAAYPPAEETPSATPEQETPSATPEQETPSATPEQETPSATPDEDGEDVTPSATPEEDGEEPTATPGENGEFTAPVLAAPEDEAELACSPPITLEWEEVNVSGTEVRYTWQLERSELRGDAGKEGPYQQRDAGTTDEASVEITDDIACETWYRWRVRVEDADDERTASAYSEGLFYVDQPGTPTPSPSPTPDTGAPNAPILIAPSSNSFFRCGEDVELIWDEVEDPSGIDRYEWEVDYSTGGRDGSYANEDRNDTPDTSVTLSALNCRDGAWFRWRVRAIDNADNIGNYSDYRYFEIETP
jgi:hypothetical protein